MSSVEDSGGGVTVHFEPAPSPALRQAGGVQVACVLYPDQDSGVVEPPAHGFPDLPWVIVVSSPRIEEVA
ncbi:MAG: hypothetical protein QM747_16245 [Nocardioides sp.]